MAEYDGDMTNDDEHAKRPRGRPRKHPLEGEKIKRPPGRPSLAPEDKKAIHIAVRLNRAEHEIWEAAARRKGMPLARFISEAVRQALKSDYGEGGE
jgi:hypothetical protein